jgi:hypothetical protein
MTQNGNPGAWPVRRLAAWLAPAGLLLLAGCGGGKGEINGEVTYQGEPVSLGRITFSSEVGKHPVASAYIIRGKYTIKDFPAGPVKIGIESFEPPRKEQLDEARKGPSPAEGMKSYRKIPPELEELANGPPLKYVPIPPTYANPDKSGLEYTVESGSQTHDIKLKPK